VKTKVGLIIPDLHVPYHDKRAWGLVLKAGKLVKPDFIVVLGDFLDCYTVSSHRKDPRRRLTLQDELDAANAELDKLDALGAKSRHFVQGNHEHRLERYLMDHAPEVFGMARPDRLLRMADRGWSYTPYGRSLRIGRMNYTHDVDGKAGPNAHAQSLQAFGGNVCQGHTHRLATCYAGNLKNETHTGVSLGWLGDANAADYKSYVKAKKDWTLGFGLALMEPNGNTHLQAVPIISYRAAVFGDIVSA
jgi:predicted phosphodiesterase